MRASVGAPPASPMDAAETQRPCISVVVPVLHEADSINDLLAHVKARVGAWGEGVVEILVADPVGDTLAAIESAHTNVRTLSTPRGRAAQMNAGAAAARGRILMFLHADTRLPNDIFNIVWTTLEPALEVFAKGRRSTGRPQPPAACACALAFAGAGPGMRAAAWGANWRNRLTRTPYGDQVHSVCAEAFHAVGGYPEQPLMEDVEFMRRLRRAGYGVRVAPQAALTSTRRYREQGPLFAMVRNNVLRLLYGLGVSAHRLAPYYSTSGVRELTRRILRMADE